MPHVHHMGQYFTHKMEYPTTKFPVLDKGDTQEIEWPYRVGKSLVLRVPFTRSAFVIGKWVKYRDEEEALASAIMARTIDYGDFHVAQEEADR